MAVTEDEFQEIVSAVLSSVRTNSKTIGQLSLATRLDNSDCLELDGGRRVPMWLIVQKVEQEINAHDTPPPPVATIVDRGIFVKGTVYYCETLNPETGIIETSDVWYHSCRFRCLVTGTTQEPTWDATDWMFIEGDPTFSVEFEETDPFFDPDDFSCELVLVAWLHNQDITDAIADADVAWTRYSEDADGNPRPASDTAWAVRRAGAGKRMLLTREDCDFNGYTPRKLRFTATVTLRDGSPDEPTAQASFEY